MAETTGIQWTDATWNPWRGCSKVSDGCSRCYAESWSKRNPGTLGIWGPHGTRVVAAESYWQQPLKWNRQAEKTGQRCRVFCASLADWLEDFPGRLQDAAGHDLWVEGAYGLWDPDDGSKDFAYRRRPLTLDDCRARILKTIHLTQHLDWLLLTKRIDGFRDRMQAVAELAAEPWRDIADGAELAQQWLSGSVMPNIWLMVSAENQAEWDRRVAILRTIPAAVRGVSAEPLLGPINGRKDMWPVHPHWPAKFVSPEEAQAAGDKVEYRPQALVSANAAFVDWVIIGGESGPNARPCDLAWVRSLVGQCREAKVKAFVKQLGSNPRVLRIPPCSSDPMALEKVNLQDPKGGDIQEFPPDLRIREMPGG